MKHFHYACDICGNVVNEGHGNGLAVNFDKSLNVEQRVVFVDLNKSEVHICELCLQSILQKETKEKKADNPLY